MEKESIWSSVWSFFFSSVSIVFFLKSFLMKESYYLEWVMLLSSSSSEMKFILYFDWTSLLFFSVVSLISSAVLLFSGSYMSSDMKVRSFIILILLFVLSMFFLIFSLNLISLLLGWDGLGLTSYLLVMHYQNSKTSAAGMITALSNRIGDAALVASVALFLEFGSWDIFSFKDLDEKVCCLLMLACITKSAQIPFSAWLPAAMAAPTPVSTLVHSSTLVTAGVYLLIRFYPWVSESSAMMVLMILSASTSFMASMNAICESDLKKVVAFSTLSQLGIMLFSLSAGFPQLAFFHLLMHAFLKALLFMCGGKLIHVLGEEQDLRKMSGLLFNLPISSMLMNLSNLALAGFPFLAGFYSKDLLMEVMLMKDHSIILLGVYFSMVGLTVIYSMRLIYFSLVGTVNYMPFFYSEEEDKKVLSASLLLAVLTLSGGALLSWVLGGSVSVVMLSVSLKYFVCLGVLFGILLGIWLMTWEESVKKSLFNFLFVEMNTYMWYLPVLSGSKSVGLMGGGSGKVHFLEKGWFEYFGGQGISSGLLTMAGLEGQFSSTLFKDFLFLFIFFGSILGL